MRTLVLILIFILIISSDLLADEKDSVSKYSGTDYYGNLFKEYDWLPEPREDYIIYSITYSMGSASQKYYDENGEVEDEIGIQEFGFEITQPNKFWKQDGNDWKTTEAALIGKFSIAYIRSIYLGFKDYQNHYNSNFRYSWYALYGFLQFEEHNKAVYFNIELGWSLGYKFQIGKSFFIFPEVIGFWNGRLSEERFLPFKLNLIIGIQDDSVVDKK